MTAVAMFGCLQFSAPAKEKGRKPALYHQETLLVGVVRRVVVSFGFRRDFIVTFRCTAVD